MSNETVLQPFAFAQADLLSLYHLTKTVREVIDSTQGSGFAVERALAATDNFGSYAAGYRCYLTEPVSKKTLYIYFGAIYSYKKQAGIFVEVDLGTNPAHFAEVAANIKPAAAYELNLAEPPFVKLFLAEADHARLMRETTPQGQKDMLGSFFAACCQAFAQSLKA